MERLFSSLSRAVEATPLMAVAASFLWGILSVVLSPCHLSSIPLIVGFIGKQGPVSTKRTFAISSFFAAGILITIAAVGTVTAAWATWDAAATILSPPSSLSSACTSWTSSPYPGQVQARSGSSARGCYPHFFSV